PQWVSQSRGQLVSHSSLPSGVATSTQCVGTSTHSAGICLSWRRRIDRPGASSSQVRSAVIAPQGRMVTVVPAFGPAPMPDLRLLRYWRAAVRLRRDKYRRVYEIEI